MCNPTLDNSQWGTKAGFSTGRHISRQVVMWKEALLIPPPPKKKSNYDLGETTEKKRLMPERKLINQTKI